MRRRAVLLCVLASALVACGEGDRGAADWPLPNLDLSSTRSLRISGINRDTVRNLHVVWRFDFAIPPRESGVFTATPIVAGGVAFVQDMESNVFALDLRTGRLRWQRMLNAGNPGPNGVAVSGGRVYGTTDDGAFALSARSGRILWRRALVSATERYVDIAPQLANGLIYVSTVGHPPAGRGILYALDAGTGAVRWERSTIKAPWRFPAEAGGGGAWYPPSVAGREVFWGTANPYPYGGTRARPNGGAFPGPALYTDSLLVVDTQDGRIRWYDQVTPHDVRDYDFQLPPVLATIGSRDVVFGAGKAGIVIAWDRATHRRIWQAKVGVHKNDSGPLPVRPVSVCPGLLGGVETPMAYADDMLFVPVVDFCSRGSAIGYEPLSGLDPSRGRGEFIALEAATGKRLWVRRLPQPVFGCATVADGVVFTSTFDGTFYAFDTADGSTLWTKQMRAGVNACPSLAGDLLLVGAGIPRGAGTVLELAAFSAAAR
jgi:alcohol dehydrogenase (cytochrome c)